MKLLTDAIKKALPPLYSSEDTPLEDKQVVVRFFNPMGSESWEIYEGSYQEGMDTWLFFGMCDLGMGSPELGYVTLAELEALRAECFADDVPIPPDATSWSVERATACARPTSASSSSTARLPRLMSV